jgi:hypothetical protein
VGLVSQTSLVFVKSALSRNSAASYTSAAPRRKHQANLANHYFQLRRFDLTQTFASEYIR